MSEDGGSFVANFRLLTYLQLLLLSCLERTVFDLKLFPLDVICRLKCVIAFFDAAQGARLGPQGTIDYDGGPSNYRPFSFDSLPSSITLPRP